MKPSKSDSESTCTCFQQPAAAPVEPPEPAPEPLSPEDERYLRHYKRLRGIISGELPIQLHLDFMYSHNHADLQILKNLKAAVEVTPRPVVSF